MDPAKLKAAFTQKDVDKPFVIFKEPNNAKLKLVIGMTAKAEANSIKDNKAYEIEGQGLCHATQDDKVIFKGKEKPLTSEGKTAIKNYCKAAAYQDAGILFHDDEEVSGTAAAPAAQSTPPVSAPTPPPTTRDRVTTFGQDVQVPLPQTPVRPTPPPPPPRERATTFGRDAQTPLTTAPTQQPTGTSGQTVPARPQAPQPTPWTPTTSSSPQRSPRPMAAAPFATTRQQATTVPPAVATPSTSTSSATPPPTTAPPAPSVTRPTTGATTPPPAKTPPQPNASVVARTLGQRTLPASVPVLPSNGQANFEATFSPQNLDSVKKNASRLGMNMGAFDEVLNGAWSLVGDAQHLAEKEKDRQSAPSVGSSTQTNNEEPASKELAELRGMMVKKYEGMLAKLRAYDGDKGGLTVSDSMRQARTNFRNTASGAIDQAITQIRYDQLSDLLKYLSDKNDHKGGLTDKEEGLYHEKRAEMLLMTTGNSMNQAASGSGVTRLLRDANGKVAYVYKSVSGESTQMIGQGMARGAGTAQEILTSKMSDILETGCGFKSGHPKTTLAKLPVSSQDGQDNVGALIQGVPGVALDKPDYNESIEKWEAMSADEQNRIAQEAKDGDAKSGTRYWDDDFPEGAYANLLNRKWMDTIRNIPPRDVQRILLMNLATVNFDSKWESVMADEQTQSYQPIDGGAAMLSAKDAIKQSRPNVSSTGPSAAPGPINPDLGSSLLTIPLGKGEVHPVADKPLDKEFVDQFKNLDLDKVRAEITGAATSLQGSDPIFKDAIGASNVETSLKSLEFIKSTINEDPKATTADFLRSYQAKLKAWLESVAGSN